MINQTLEEKAPMKPSQKKIAPCRYTVFALPENQCICAYLSAPPLSLREALPPLILRYVIFETICFV